MTAVTPERDEPVAWRGKLGSDPTRQHWNVCSIDPTGLPGWHSVEPLYTRPAPSPATDEVVAVLRELVEINEQHNAAVEKVIGRPVGWKDSYLDRARSLLAKLEVRG